MNMINIIITLVLTGCVDFATVVKVPNEAQHASTLSAVCTDTDIAAGMCDPIQHGMKWAR